MGDLTLFEALTGGAFDRLTGNIAGNLTKIFQKSQMPGGLPGGAWAVLELTRTLQVSMLLFFKFIIIYSSTLLFQILGETKNSSK